MLFTLLCGMHLIYYHIHLHIHTYLQLYKTSKICYDKIQDDEKEEKYLIIITFKCTTSTMYHTHTH